MHEFHGDLLIGGMRLERLRCELEEERHKRGCKEWTLSGHLRLTPEQSKHLELNREYRIQLDDGRAGQVMILRIEPDHDREALADFVPSRATKAKAK